MSMEQKRFVFIKPYHVEGLGTLAEGSEITIVHGVVYFNGGMCSAYHGRILYDIINNEKLKLNYLKEVNIIYNKI